LFYHEIAHIIRGHTDYARAHRFGILRDHPTADLTTFPIQQALENDADGVAIDFLIRVRSATICQSAARQRRRELSELLLALAALFAIMDRPSIASKITLEGPYAHPLHRFFNVVDSAGGSAGLLITTGPNDVKSAAKRAVLELQKVSHLLGIPAAR